MCADMLDEEKFIGEVGKSQTLYDITMNDYSIRELRVKCWMDLCV
jgi:hypothetical protein